MVRKSIEQFAAPERKKPRPVSNTLCFYPKLKERVMRVYGYIVQLLVVLVIAGCASQQVGVTKYTGFSELPFPSNAYASGQIIEIYSSPKKVEITFDPKIPWDQATVSEGWRITGSESENIKSNFAIKITKILKGTAGYNSDKKVKVDFSDTQTRIVPKNTIFAAVGKSIQEDPTLSRLLESYRKNGTHFDVITQTLNASISFSIVDTSGAVLDVDSEVIKKLNSEFNLNFERKVGNNKTITGSNLVVGIHYDPEMIDILMK